MVDDVEVGTASPLDVFRVTPEEARAIYEAERAEKADERKDLRVCICGHSARSHTSESISDQQEVYRASGRFQCITGKMKCPCKAFDSVAVVSSVRNFTYKTTGPGAKHALFRGIVALMAGGGTLTWTETPRCRVCGAQDVPVELVSVNAQGVIMNAPARENLFLCDTHLQMLTQLES